MSDLEMEISFVNGNSFTPLIKQKFCENLIIKWLQAIERRASKRKRKNSFRTLSVYYPL